MSEAPQALVRRGGSSCASRWPLLASIRYPEVLLLEGPPVMGALVSLGTNAAPRIPSLALLGVANFFLVAHIWTFNDWSNLAADSGDPNKSPGVFSSRGVDPATMLRFSLALLVASLSVFVALPVGTLWVAASIALLGIVYSHPRINAKGRPLVSTLTHLAGGELHFLLGYSVFAAVDWNAARTGSLFALVFAAGHATQEVQDHGSDEPSGVRTNAAFFGKRPVFLASFAGFALAYLDLLWLSLTGALPHLLWILPLVVLPIHGYWTVEALRGGLTRAGVGRLRVRYRILFTVIGLALAAALAFQARG